MSSDHDTKRDPDGTLANVPKPAVDPSSTLAELPETSAGDDDLSTLAEIPGQPKRDVDSSKTLAELPEPLSGPDASLSTLPELPGQMKRAVDSSSTLAELPEMSAKEDASLSTLPELPGQMKRAVDSSSTLAELPEMPAKEVGSLSTLPELPGQMKRAVDSSSTLAELPETSAKEMDSLSTLPELPGQPKRGVDPLGTVPELSRPSGAVNDPSSTLPQVPSGSGDLSTIAPGAASAEPRPKPTRTAQWIGVGIGGFALIACGLVLLWWNSEPKTAGPKTAPELTAKLLPKTTNGPDERMADWVQNHDGSITAETAAGHAPTPTDKTWWVVAIDVKNRPNLADMPALGGLKRLRELRLEHCGLTDQAVADLPELPTLTKLSLGGNPIGDAAIAYLSRFPGVVDLGLDGTKITDAALDMLATRPALRSLDVRGTATTRAGVKRIGDRFPTCEVRSDIPPEPKIVALPVESNRAVALWALARKGTVGLAGPAKKSVRSAAELPSEPFQVDVIQVAVKKGPLLIPTFTELAEITRLELTSNELTDADVAKLGAMPKLGILRLSGPLTDAAVPSVVRYPMLRYVGLSRTKLTDAGLAKLKAELPHCRVESDLGPKEEKK
jgi:Leucine Rich repeat